MESERPVESEPIDKPKKKSFGWIRMTLIFILGAALVVMALGYRRVKFGQDMGEGPAGPSVSREAFESEWSDRKVHLLGVGDSVTSGFGVASNKTYFRMLIDNPPNDFEEMQGLCLSEVLPNLSSENIAVSGSNSQEHWDVQIESMETYPDDVFGLVVMTSGGNDLIHWYGRKPPKELAMYGATLEQAEPWIANFEERLGMMLDKIDASFPGGCLIFLADIYDPTDGVGKAPPLVPLPDWADAMEILARYNEVISEAAEKRDCVQLVPMHQEFLGHGLYCKSWFNPHYCSDDPHYWYGAVLEDPNERGYDAVRRLFLNEIVGRKDEIVGE